MSDGRYRILRSSGKCLKIVVQYIDTIMHCSSYWLIIMLNSKIESELLSLPYLDRNDRSAFPLVCLYNDRLRSSICGSTT